MTNTLEPLDGADAPSRRVERRLGAAPNPAPSLRTTTALVTGGGRGIGRLVAEGLARSGAAVGLVGRSERDLAATVDSIRAAGGTAEAVTADVSHPSAITPAVQELRHRLGPVDLLVNNAGVLGPIGPLWEVDALDWWTTMEVNVRGVVLASQLVLPEMAARRRGRIVNVTSQAGVHRWPLVSAYSISKAAVVKLTENLAHETARYGVSVFSVHPGLLPIGLTATLAARPPTNAYEDAIRRWGLTEIEQGRGADPALAVRLILRLATGEGDAFSGRHLSVHDDLDLLLSRVEDVHDHDLYVLGLDRLARRRPSAPGQPGAVGSAVMTQERSAS